MRRQEKMSILQNKIDFTVLVKVINANPNGDPLNGNRPRTTYSGQGEISDVCIKRKIRNRLQDMGENIFVQSDERSNDGFKSLSERASNNKELKAVLKDREAYASAACKQWTDVRAFGQVFAFKANNVSVGVRGPVSIRTAESINPVVTTDMQITKSVNSEPSEKRSSDTMGMKHRVDFGLYVCKGSINHQLAEKTGFSEEDAEKIKEALCSLFMNDASSARPEGSMEVCKVYWWKHNCLAGQYSSAKVHNSLKVEVKNDVDTPNCFEDFTITLSPLEDLEPEIYDGI